MKVYFFFVIAGLLFLACNNLEKTVNPTDANKELAKASELTVTEIMVNKVINKNSDENIIVSDRTDVVKNISTKPSWQITFSQSMKDHLLRTQGRILLYKSDDNTTPIALKVPTIKSGDEMTLIVELAKPAENEILLLEGENYYLEIQSGLKIQDATTTYIVRQSKKINFQTVQNKDTSIEIGKKLEDNIKITIGINEFTVDISNTPIEAVPLVLKIDPKSTIRSCIVTSTSKGAESCKSGTQPNESCSSTMECTIDQTTKVTKCNFKYPEDSQCKLELNCSNLEPIDGKIENQNFSFIEDGKVVDRIFTVTAQNGCVAHYFVRITNKSTEKKITSFMFEKAKNPSLTEDLTGVIDGSFQIKVTTPIGVDRTNLIPTIKISPKSVMPPNSLQSQDFTKKVKYVVTAEDSTEREYTVIVTEEVLSNAKEILRFELKEAKNPDTGLSKDIKGVISVNINDATGEESYKITATVPLGTDRTKLKPTITVSDKSTVSPSSLDATSFVKPPSIGTADPCAKGVIRPCTTKPITYTVTAEDGSTKEYEVTILETNPIVTFNPNGGKFSEPNTESEQEVEKNSKISKQPGVTLTGSNLEGWFIGIINNDGKITLKENKFNFAVTPIVSNIQFYAKWTPEIIHWEVTYDTDGAGTLPISSIENDDLLTSITTLSKKGYTFVNWYDSADKMTGKIITLPYKTTPPNQNITLYAKWTANDNIITFDLNGGSAGTSMGTQEDLTATRFTPVMSGNMITKPSIPVRTGYTFVDWFTAKSGGKIFDFVNTRVFGDVTLYARWKPKKYTVSFFNTKDSKCNDITPKKLIEEQMVEFQGIATLPTETIECTGGYKFLGWHTKIGDKYEDYDFSSTPVVSDINIETKWEKKQYTITYDLQKGVRETSSMGVTTTTSDNLIVTVEHNVSPSRPQNVKRTGYTFKHWSLKKTDPPANFFNPAGYSITKNITLFAIWVPITYTVYIKISENEVLPGIIDGIKTGYNTLIEYPTSDKLGQTGAVFIGIFTSLEEGAEEFNFDLTRITKNTDLYAHYTYAIAFFVGKSNKNQLVQSIAFPEQKVRTGGKVSLPTNTPPPNSDGKAFKEWIINEELDPAEGVTVGHTQNAGVTFDFNTKITKSMRIYARYEP